MMGNKTFCGDVTPRMTSGLEGNPTYDVTLFSNKDGDQFKLPNYNPGLYLDTKPHGDMTPVFDSV